MGLVLEPGEVRSWIQDMQNGLEQDDRIYQAALRAIQDFSNQEELQGESWDKLKNQLLLYHQLAVHGMTIGKEEIERDLIVLEREIGEEYLSEDELLEDIRQLEEECRQYERKIEAWESLGRILGGLLSYAIIQLYRDRLVNARRIIKELEKKLEILEDIEDITSKLFIQSLDIYDAVRNAIQDMEVSISGKGKMSNGDWKSLLRNLWEEDNGTISDPEGVLDDLEEVLNEETDNCIGQPVGEKLNHWLQLYDGMTVMQEGRIVEMTEGVIPGKWAMKEGLKNINYYARKAIEGTNCVIIGDNGELIDKDGRYWVAVGPNVMNPSHKKNEACTADEMKYGTKIDVVVSDADGNQYYIPCIVGDCKAHTYPNGIYQTGDAFPNGQDSHPQNNDNSVVEFCGQGEITGFGDYSIEKIIVYDLE